MRLLFLGGEWPWRCANFIFLLLAVRQLLFDNVFLLRAQSEVSKDTEAYRDTDVERTALGYVIHGHRVMVKVSNHGAFGFKQVGV